MSNDRQRKKWYLSKNAKRSDNGNNVNSLLDLIYSPTDIVDFNGTTINNVTVCGTLKGNIIANIIGDITGNLTGNVTGDICGNIYTDYIFDKNGDGQIDIEGNIISNIIGNVFGTVIGSVQSFSILSDRTLFMKNSFGVIGYFPWDQSNYSSYSTSTVTVYSIIGDVNRTIGIKVTDVDNAIVLGTINIIGNGIQTFNITLPSSDTLIKFEGQCSGTIGSYPYIYCLTFEIKI